MKNWEASPIMWITISVVAGVTTAVVASALQKWWGLKLQQQRLSAQASAQALHQPVRGKYQLSSVKTSY